VQPLLEWKSNEYYIFWVCVSVTLVSQHAMRLRRLSSVTWSSLKYFCTLSHLHGTIFGKILLVIKRAFWFSLQLLPATFLITLALWFPVWNISHSNRNSAKYCHKYAHVIMWITCCPCQILMGLEFYGQIFEKNYSNTKFRGNPSSGSRVLSYGRKDGRTDGHD
jgi:hypothetical protein